ncbi:hypothetical protein IHQ56_02920 [Methylobacillus flagellatus]|uniref:DUF58 domain-containing protein n=1 Tax=Methylobacillus flagellatus TaxID=405 RepID=UPI002853BAF9|nr:hypothetical protein [Methylobacillus flagellatus]MDR5170761.1 hypothetical protein [Methylobacillus flagellatus]
MLPSYIKPFSYQIPWKSSSVHAGDHLGVQRGLGFEYKGNTSLIDYPDLRRMDLRQSLRDPYEQVQVRLFYHDSITPVYAVCDLSSSMQYKGARRKIELVQEVAASIAYSVSAENDVFSLIGYDQHVLDDYLLPLGYQVHEALERIDAFTGIDALGRGSTGILEVGPLLSQNKGLVFWISDFHMPFDTIIQAMNMLSRHQVVPVVLWEEEEYRRLPRFGLGTMLDPETGRDRTIFFRESIRAKFITAFEQRRAALEDLFLAFESPPHFVSGVFEAEAMTHYFEKYLTA